jgi:hypothetical protein
LGARSTRSGQVRSLNGQSVVGAICLLLSTLTGASGQSSAPEPDRKAWVSGCWTARSATRLGNYDEATRCFLGGGYWHGWYFEGDHKLGGDAEGTWRFKDNQTLVIDGEDCALEITRAGQAIVLANCPHAGEWFRDRERDRLGK